MYHRVLSGIDSERRNTAQTIAQYEARIAASKQEVLNRVHEPIFNVQKLNEEVTDMFKRFKEGSSRPGKTTQAPSLQESLYGFHSLVVNASNRQQVSMVPLLYDLAELVQEAGMSTTLKLPNERIQVSLSDAQQISSELKRTLLLSCRPSSRLTLEANKQEDFWEMSLRLDNTLENFLEIEPAHPGNPHSFEFTRSTLSTLVIKFRLSNIGT